MKDGKEYSKKIKKLFSGLKRNGKKVKKPEYNDPVEALVYAALSEYMTAPAANAAYKKILSHFVDLNDLRVSRPEEVTEVIGSARAGVNEITDTLNGLLQAVFAKYDKPSLADLGEMGKRPAREVLEKLESVSPYIVDYVVLTSLNGHAIPMTNRMIDFLKTGDYVHPDADRKSTTGFLERQIAASNGYASYSLLRQVSEASRKTKTKVAKKKVVKKKAKPKAATAKKKTKKKTKKK